jgi:hypothetical protein
MKKAVFWDLTSCNLAEVSLEDAVFFFPEKLSSGKKGEPLCYS